jgi:hypothetical protein
MARGEKCNLIVDDAGFADSVRRECLRKVVVKRWSMSVSQCLV